MPSWPRVLTGSTSQSLDSLLSGTPTRCRTMDAGIYCTAAKPSVDSDHSQRRKRPGEMSWPLVVGSLREANPIPLSRYAEKPRSAGHAIGQDDGRLS
jgi:hypothetical protein